jgi:hypothetical protein
MNEELENQIYTELKDKVDDILARYGDINQHKWRGMAVMYCLQGFLNTAMNSSEGDPHSTMQALDHMFVQITDIYKAGTDITEKDLMNEIEKMDSELAERMKRASLEEKPTQVDEDEDVDDKLASESSPSSS